MSSKIVVPELSESISEATVGRWLKQEGEPVREGEAVVALETDKVDLEVGAEANGVLAKVERNEGETVVSGDVLGLIEERAAGEAAAEEAETAAVEPRREAEPGEPAREEGTEAPTAAGGARETAAVARGQEREAPSSLDEGPERDEDRPEEREKLSPRRRTIAARLVEAQKNAAALTTFNEVDMSAVMELRKRFGPEFENRYGVRLGIVSFFVKASVGALKSYPRLNSELSGDELIIKKYYDVGIAVADARGLVVPVIRNADRLAFAGIERAIADLASRARSGALGIEELRGGTFTITNGGVFGSLWSTPILNAPQTAILGLHRIQERPVARGGEIALRPMMYLALSYDHRVVDGSDAVPFLGRVKQLVENPERLLFEQ